MAAPGGVSQLVYAIAAS